MLKNRRQLIGNDNPSLCLQTIVFAINCKTMGRGRIFQSIKNNINTMSLLPEVSDGVIVEKRVRIKRPLRLNSEQKQFSKRARGTNSRANGTNPRAKAKALWKEHFQQIAFIKHL
jgi:hypothetical protein